MFFLRTIRNKIEEHHLTKKWRKINTDNFTDISGLKNWNRVSVGKNTYGKINVSDFNPNTGKSKLMIGSYCSIGEGVNFLLGGGHYENRFSTYPFEFYIYGKEESIEKGNIEIEDDVWIGNDVTIMSGVKIGKGAIIGTKALVTKDIPSYAVAVGIPAHVIKYRFKQNIIEKLKKVDYSKLDFNDVKSNSKLFDGKLTKEKLEKIEQLLNRK